MIRNRAFPKALSLFVLVLVGCFHKPVSSGTKALSQVHTDAPSRQESALSGEASLSYPFIDDDLLTCSGSQEMTTFSLDRIEAGIQAHLLPKDRVEAELRSVMDDPDRPRGIRFDFCANFDAPGGGDFTLKQIIVAEGAYYSFGRLNPNFVLLKPSEMKVIPAFKKALVYEDYADVEMVFVGLSQSYFIKGVPATAERESYLTVSRFSPGTDPREVLENVDNGKFSASAGNLEVGDVFSEYSKPTRTSDWVIASFDLSTPELEFHFQYELTRLVG